MQRLSGFDAAFWFGETDQFPLNGAGLLICDPSDAPNFSFAAVRDLLAARFQELAPLRYRVAGHRLGFDRPWLVDDPSADVDFHVRRIAVPAPGGRRELDAVVSRLMSYPMDRTRPLWEIWFIEGVEHGRVAILNRSHHAFVDGISSQALYGKVFGDDTGPSTADRSPQAPGLPRLDQRALGALVNLAVMTPYRLVRLTRQTLVQRRAVRGLTDTPPRLFEAPVTRFNTQTSPQRRVSGARVSLDRIQAVKRSFAVKLNDVVLALVSDAIRDYLRTRGELPERPLVAQIGMSLPGHDAMTGNQVTSATIRLPTNVADPAARLRDVYESMVDAKRRASTLAAHQVIRATDVTPPGLWALMIRAYAASGAATRFVPVNVAISNIHGPDTRLRIAGATVEQCTPIGPLSLNIGLNVTCMTYDGWAEFGFVSSPEIADDLDDMSGALESALQALEKAAGI